MIDTNSLIEHFTDFYINTQTENGAFPAGHNGLYFDLEKPTRNTAHMLFLLAKSYEIEPSERIKASAEISIDYLLSEDVRPNDGAFYCRDKKGKDHCNGLIGQAWVMEALIKASKVFDRDDCYQLAESVFLKHKWDSLLGIWYRLEITGQQLSFDGTFNHQLWFAAVASQLYKTPVAKHRANVFLDKVAKKASTYPNGVIFHNSEMGGVLNYLSLGPRRFFGEIKRRFLLKNSLDEMYSKSVGYHGFNLYAYAMLKEVFPSNSIWESSLINKITSVVNTTTFKSELVESEFGYFYNVSGIEIAYAMEALCEDRDSAQAWIDMQFKYTFEGKSAPLTKSVIDKNTANVRLYELGRLNNYSLTNN